MKVSRTVWSGGKSRDNFKGLPIAISVRGEEVVVHTSTYTLNRLKVLVEENEFALIPIHMEAGTIILDFDSPEKGLEELEGATEEI